MKTKEEIERLSYKYSDKVNMFNDWTSHSIADAVTYGYNQCLKDMANYIFEVAKEFHRLGKYSGTTSDSHFTDIYKETINSLNK